MVDGKEYTDGYASFDIGGSVRPYGCRGMFPARTAGAAGAFIGEMLHDRTDNVRAFRVAFGSFLAFVLGTGLKLVVSLLMTFAIVKAVLF